MDAAVLRSCGLKREDIAFLERVERGMPIVADISRADILLYCRGGEDEAAVVAQARPHSVAPIYEPICGQAVSRGERPVLFGALESGKPARASQRIIADGAPIFQEMLPLFGSQRSLLGALTVEKTMIEHERHKRRLPSFRWATRELQKMLASGILGGAEELSPFGEHDGILVVNSQRQILYASGIANNLYRRLGYMESLVGKELKYLVTSDEALVEKVLREVECLEEEAQEGERIWIRKVLPLLSPDGWWRFWERGPQVVGALVTIHDATAARRREREAKIRSAMIQEIHHRVKNNLQSIAALLRLQARRAGSRETRKALRESISRILSVAVIHEFLSRHESRVINLKEVSRRVVDQLQEGVMDPSKEIQLSVRGPNIYLPAQQATACALVINELLQNSLEHGYRRRKEGTIAVKLREEADSVTIEIDDDGRGLPPDFDLEADRSLGLQIVQTLVEDDLGGRFELKDGGGVRAIVTFPKVSLGGESWEELE